jgi:O-6-methylguanine DNA methyltransferase
MQIYADKIFMKKEFKDRVLKVVKKIPKGQTLSYGEVASLAGSPRAARAVGNLMKKNCDKGVPCHRVIKTDGTLGGYSGLNGKKAQLLKKEGAKFK